ncbi:MAG: PaaI family thioesterase [Proteobacteria bacterium]|nr:PaaI family thioesterase [Pseudomonadota bacterium]
MSRELPSSPYGDFLGISMLDYGDGLAECCIQLQPHHLNTGGRVHGGVLSSLADTAAGVAVRSIRPEGTLTATTDLSMSFIRPPRGNDLLARAKVIHAGKQLYRVEVDIVSAEKLVARSSATFMIVAPFEKS